MDRRYVTLIGLLCVLGTMGTLTAFAVPLYDLFCRTTGFGGTTQVADRPAETTINRVITIRFNADTHPSLPWRFEPKQDSMRLRVGEPALAYYTVRSKVDFRTTGTATFNVTPAKAGQYFSKMDCFCFTEQAVRPGETIEMPVQFFVDPEIAADRNLDDVQTITLSYMFFRKEGDEEPGLRAALETPAGIRTRNGN